MARNLPSSNSYVEIVLISERAMSDEIQVYTIAPSIETTFSLEIVKTGLLKKRKHYLFFEDYSGEIHYNPSDLASCSAWLKLKTESLVCRDKWLKAAKQKAVSAFAKKELQADEYPEIEFQLSRLTA